ncbi:hypothetical protein ACFL0H_04215 [Thermodesulfobacteriota bacterium]
MNQTFKSFMDIIYKDKSNKPKTLFFRIIEVVEGNKDEKEKSAGHEEYEKALRQDLREAQVSSGPFRLKSLFGRRP